jgi:tetratricopeptide (TPR) repeat protein
MSVACRYVKSVCLHALIGVCLSTLGCSNQTDQGTARPALTVSFDPPPEVRTPPPYEKKQAGTLSFAADIAPIVFEKCAACHRPEGIGPFPLLTYDDVNKHARQIVEVTRKRMMPPWSPVPGYCEFDRDGGLSTSEIGMISQWVDEGQSAGNPSELPPLPEFPSGWKYGKPDLVVAMPEPFQVPAAAPTDIYRKFVIRVPIHETKYVRAFDFDPGNKSVVHHMRLRVDRSSSSRAQDLQDPLPGFDGTMFSGDTEPDGFFLVWAPGYELLPKRADLAWTLRKGTDLVLELHLHPTGKEESVQSSIGLYFQPDPPREQLYMVQLTCETIDIAPGAKSVQYEDRYELPVDTTILAVMPHAHFLATDIRSWAVLPDGTKRWLMRIADWDFNWQREYVYTHPIELPSGTTLCMQITYDNSADNLRNPHNPPRRVFIGRDTFNEMAQVFFQVLATDPREGDQLLMDFARKDFKNNLLRQQFLIECGQGTSEVYFNLGCLQGAIGDSDQAIHHYQESIRLKPDNIFAINNLGSLYRNLGRPEDALQQYSRALEINPGDFRVHFNLGLVYLEQGRLEDAATAFEAAVRINSDLAEAWMNLGSISVQRRQLRTAQDHFRRALKADPDLESARVQLKRLEQQVKDFP